MLVGMGAAMNEGDAGLWAAALTALIVLVPVAVVLTVDAVWRRRAENDESPRH